MLKKILALLLAFLVLFSAASAAENRITDKAGLFTEEEIKILEEQIRRFQMDAAMDFVVLTSNEDLRGMTQQEFADSFYDEGSFGMGPHKSGILYYIDMFNRIPYISTAGDMIRFMTDARIQAAHKAIYDSLAEGKYAVAVVQMITVVKAFVYTGIPFGQYNYFVD